jgi:hypothetical protein
MSHPLYNGGLLGAMTSDNRPYVIDDGNWSMQGTPENPAYRSISLLVDGAEVFGFYPTALDEPFQQAVERQGCFLRADALAWRGPQLAQGQSWEIKMKAGNRYVGWGDSLGQDKMEWGSGDPVNASRELLATTGVIVVGTPPPPNGGGGGGGGSSVCDGMAEMADNIRAEQQAMTATDPEAWIKQNQGEANEILRLIVYAAFSKDYPAKELKSHAGRAGSGIAQNGRTSMRL